MYPHGPRPVGQKSQVGIPPEVMAALHLEPNDKVWFVLADDLPGCAVMVPVEIVGRVWDAGWNAVFKPTTTETMPTGTDDED